MWVLPLLVIGAIVITAASRSPREAPLYPQLALPEPLEPEPPGPIAVLGEIARTGQNPPPAVVLCAIAEAEATGREDLASDIVRTFIAPFAYAQATQAQVQPAYALLAPAHYAPIPYERGSCAPPVSPRSISYDRGPAPYERGSCAPPVSPRSMRGALSPRRAPPMQVPPMQVQVPVPAAASQPASSAKVVRSTDFPVTDEEIRAMLNADPERLFALATAPMAAAPPTAPTPQADAPTPQADALADQLLFLQLPGHAGAGIVRVDPSRTDAEIFEVRWLRGHAIPALPPTIDGRPVRVVVVDALPVAQASPEVAPPQPTGLPPEAVAQMQEAAGLHEAADQTRAIAPGSPIAGISDDAWRKFVVLLSREAPTYNSGRSVGQFRQRRERLTELGIDPNAILGSAQAQRAALDVDLADAYHHATEGGLIARFVGRRVAVPGRDEPEVITLSGILGVIQCAGIDNAVGWLERQGDRKRYPNTTQAFLHTNGIY